MIFHNNCVRNRVNYFCPLILVGNTVTRNSSLIKNFGVDLYKAKKGEITVVKNRKNEPTCVFEYCAEVEVMQEAADTYYNRFENDRIKMIYKGDWTIGNYPMQPKQVTDDALTLASIKIITPADTALLFEFKLSPAGLMFGYLHRYEEDDTPYTAVLLNKIQIFKSTNVFNYLPSGGFFKKFVRLVYTKNVYFDSMETGEHFRDFLKNFKGAEMIANVYK